MTVQPEPPHVHTDPATTATFEVRGASFYVDLAEHRHPPEKNPYFRLARRGCLYEPVMTYALAHILGQDPSARFLDVGSRMGYYASMAAAFVDDASQVHAVEADPYFATRTSRSCRLGGHDDVRVHSVVLSDTEEEAGLDGRGIVFDEGMMTTVTCDTLCHREEFEPTVVKMDVHGCEGKVLTGMRTTLRSHVRHLLLELHDTFRLERFSPGIDRSSILRILEESGFTIFHVAGHEMPTGLARDDGFTYRRLDTSDSTTFYDRCGCVLFLLASKSPDLAPVLGESVDDPRFS